MHYILVKSVIFYLVIVSQQGDCSAVQDEKWTIAFRNSHLELQLHKFNIEYSIKRPEFGHSSYFAM